MTLYPAQAKAATSSEVTVSHLSQNHIGVVISNGFIPADGKEHSMTTNVHACTGFSGGCYEVYHIKVTLDSTRQHVHAPVGAIQNSVIHPNDPIGSYNPGYVYTYNRVDVYASIGGNQLYSDELETEDYYNFNITSNVWERPACTTYFPGVDCGYQSTGNGYDPNKQALQDWLNGYVSGNYPYPYGWQNQVFLTTYVTIWGGFSCSDSVSNSDNHSLSCW